MTLQFAAKGANLTILDINEKGLEETKKMVKEKTGNDSNVHLIKCDISDREAVDALAAKLCKMNCAPHSVAITAGVTFYNDWIDADNNTWERDVEQIFNVNLSGPINIARSFLPIMEKTGGEEWF